MNQHDETQLINDIRFTALEFLTEKLWAAMLAMNEPKNSHSVKVRLIEFAGKWQLSPGTPPLDVEKVQSKMKIVQKRVEQIVQNIELGEEENRAQMNQPPLGQYKLFP